MEDFYPDSLFDTKKIINRLKYKGIGRPRKKDYMSFRQAQKQINKFYNDYLNRDL